MALHGYHVNAARTLRELSALGIVLDVEGGKVKAMYPPGLRPTEAIRDKIKNAKPHLLELLGELAYCERAPRERWCTTCARAAERGERVLLCRRCDMPREAS